MDKDNYQHLLNYTIKKLYLLASELSILVEEREKSLIEDNKRNVLHYTDMIKDKTEKIREFLDGI
jgi:hypothetical protein